MDPTRRTSSSRAINTQTAIKTEPVTTEATIAVAQEEKPIKLYSTPQVEDLVKKPKQKQEVLTGQNDEVPAFTPVPSAEYEKKYSTAYQVEQVLKHQSSLELNERIDGLHLRLNYEIKTELSILACKAVLAALEYGSIWQARKLLQAMGSTPKGQVSKTPYRPAALKAWFLEYGPFDYKEVATQTDYTTGQQIKDKSKSLIFDKTKRDKLLKLYRLDQQAFVKNMVSNPFWNFAPESNTPTTYKFNLRAELNRLLQRAAKAEEKLGTENAEIDLFGLEDIRKIIPKLNAGQKTISIPEKKEE